MWSRRHDQTQPGSAFVPIAKQGSEIEEQRTRRRHPLGSACHGLSIEAEFFRRQGFLGGWGSWDGWGGSDYGQGKGMGKGAKKGWGQQGKTRRQ